MQKTDIQWTDYSSSPIKLRLHKSGKTVNACVKVSEGCRGCYAESITRHWWPKVEGKFPGYTPALMKLGDIVLNDDEIHKLLTFKPKPPFKNGKTPMVFIEDMSDAGGEFVSDEILDRLFAVFALRPDVIFQLLTKRPERMAAYLNSDPGKGVYKALAAMLDTFPHRQASQLLHQANQDARERMSNVWLGTSVENQKCADERIPHLLRCPAAVRFLSCEPLLEGVDLEAVSHTIQPGYFGDSFHAIHRPGTPEEIAKLPEYPGVNWVIVGGESGPKAREFHMPWVRSIVRQCGEASVACFVKQLGASAWSANRTDHVDARQFGSVDVAAEPLRMWLQDSHGGDMSEWPSDLRIRQFPSGGAK